MSENKVEAQLYQDCFLNVMALFTALKGQPSRGVRRAELKQGEVTPEAIDFIADVEIKAKRTLKSYDYTRLMHLASLDRYQEAPIDLQNELGQVFLKNDLNYDGDYRVHYYRAKNNQLMDREEPMQDLGASKPVPVEKPEPKRTLEHAVVKACGHSIDLRHPPTQANCEDCWTAFFTLAVDTPSLHNVLVGQGRAGLERMVGKKFVKHFGKFLQRELKPPVEVPQVESAIEGSILNINAEREANLGIR